MSYQVLISDNAKKDLEGIADYICNSLYVPVAAQKILKKLQDSILGLSDFPERYKYRSWSCEYFMSVKMFHLC